MGVVSENIAKTDENPALVRTIDSSWFYDRLRGTARREILRAITAISQGARTVLG